MENEQIIKKVAQNLKNREYVAKIKEYLTSENIPESEFDAIFSKARNLIFEETIPSISKKNKITFTTYVVLAVLSLLYFTLILPYQIESDSTFLAILGALIVSALAVMAFAYYESWKFEFIKKQQKPKIDYSVFGLVMLIPAFILYFIISSRFENVAETLLKENQIEVTGKIVSGYERNLKSLRREITLSSIIVAFKTIEGKDITVNLDISEREFKEYYINQEVKLIYSKTNPSNISLLTTTSNITKFKDTKEEDISINELLGLINTKPSDIEKELNTFSYGWEFNSEQNIWTNNRREIAIGLKENAVIYVSKNPQIIKHHLEKNGFKSEKKNSKDIISYVNADGTYKKEGYTATIESMRIENGEAPLAITTITKN